MALPNSGTFSYNGVFFVSLYKSKIEVKPVKDSAGRALVAREYTLDVEGHVAGVGSTDATLAAMRVALEKPAGALTYTGKGFGPLNVNVPGGVYDAAYGPWPEVLSWQPVGSDQGCLVRWKCTTVLPCEEFPQTTGIVEFCWEESWDIDEDAYTTRGIDGHLTIQATRAAVGARNIPDNADAYREQVTPDLPIGFKRTQNFKLSEDKRTLEFHFRDEELPQPLPDGVTRCEVVHRAKWTLPKAGTKQVLISSLSGSLTLPARTPKAFAWDKIMLIMRSRWPVGSGAFQFTAGASAAVQGVAAGAAGSAAGIKGKPPVAGPGATFLLQDVEIEDEVFGRSVRFSANCVIIPSQLVDDTIAPSHLLTSTGLWAPMPNTDFLRWKQSLFGLKKPYGPRGVANMGFQNSDDAIVDLCSRGALLKGNSSSQLRNLVGVGQAPRMANGSVLLPQNTWLVCRMRLRLVEEERIIRHKPLYDTTLRAVEPLTDDYLTDDYADSPGLVPPQDNEIGGFITQPETGTPAGVIGVQDAAFTVGQLVPDLLQQVSTPTQTIRLEGFAVRIGYPIPTPRLVAVGIKPVVQLYQKVSQEQISTIGGVPVYGARWCIDYAPSAGGVLELPMPVNPALE